MNTIRLNWWMLTLKHVSHFKMAQHIDSLTKIPAVMIYTCLVVWCIFCFPNPTTRGLLLTIVLSSKSLLVGTELFLLRQLKLTEPLVSLLKLQCCFYFFFFERVDNYIYTNYINNLNSGYKIYEAVEIKKRKQLLLCK
jgi:hypothetical protein